MGYNLKGVKYDKKGAEEAEILLSKLENEEKVRRQCKIQYRKLIEILKEHKVRRSRFMISSSIRNILRKFSRLLGLMRSF